MSSHKNFIELDPPRYDQTKEVIQSCCHECNKCHGEGMVNIYENRGGFHRETCPLCKGSGMVDATVTIEWKASKMSENGKFKA